MVNSAGSDFFFLNANFIFFSLFFQVCVYTEHWTAPICIFFLFISERNNSLEELRKKIKINAIDVDEGEVEVI